MPVAVAPLPSRAAPSAVAAAADRPHHGRRAGGIALRPEEAAWYAELLADHERLYRPQDAAEASLVEQLCLVELKLARLDRLELAALEEDPGEVGRRLAAFVRYRARITKERWELEHRLRQLAERREAQRGDPAAARAAVQDAARVRALGSLALLGLATGDRQPGTNEPEPAATSGTSDAREAGPR